MFFSKQDTQQILNHGLTIDKVEVQLNNFSKGFPFVKLVSPAVIEDGILSLIDKEIDSYVSYYENIITKHKVLKFVPASGAATRMFKDLIDFIGKYNGLPYTLKEFPAVKKTIDNLEKFAFYEELKICIESKGLSIEEYLNKGDYASIINFILSDIGLNYSNSPKAWLSFHNYADVTRKSIEEHLVEASYYSKQEDNTINIHFTVSPEHKEGFKRIIDGLVVSYNKRYKSNYTISYSIQKTSTDIIAVNEDLSIAYDKAGKIIFRPAGHGALIENLNDLNGDIIFIKNIDNVAHDKLKHYTYKYKKLLAGILLKTQEKVFDALNVLEKGTLTSQNVVDIFNLCTELGISLNNQEKSESDMIRVLFNKLNRPIRVCGMVKNVGEPGGGPFWVEKNSQKSLQIIESAQVNFEDEEQVYVFKSSTHFNPVDLVCGVRNFRGENFDLLKYTDPDTGFISSKTKDGVRILAQELPGLWNGAMADWITIFVEVPLETFTPVKEINDLLREEHQA